MIDLGSPKPIGGFEIFNTRNGPYDDRGTGDFSIHAANALFFIDGFHGFDLSGAETVLASGRLTTQTYAGGFNSQGGTPLVPDEFLSNSAIPFRYLRFDALSIGAAGDKGFGPAGVGINEFRVFAAVPEPSSLLLAALAGASIGAMLSRKTSRVGQAVA